MGRLSTTDAPTYLPTSLCVLSSTEISKFGISFFRGGWSIPNLIPLINVHYVSSILCRYPILDIVFFRGELVIS